MRVPPNLVLLNDNNNHVIKMQKNLQPIKPAIHPKDTNVKKLKTRVSFNILFSVIPIVLQSCFNSGMTSVECNTIKSKELAEKR